MIENISAKIKAYRQRLEMSQQSLAKKLDVHRSQITRWENPKVKLNKYTVYFLKMEGII